MSDDGRLLQLPKLSGNTDDEKTPLPESKQNSIRKRLEARVSLAEQQYADNGDIQGYCPFHEDVVASNKPSARFNPVYGYWFCFAPKEDGCAEQGSGANLDKMLRKLKGEKADNGRVRDISSAPSKRKKSSVPEVTEQQALQMCNDLQGNPGALAALKTKRLWTAETVALLGIGIVDGTFMDGLANKPRITIPVYSSKGKYVGCRIYDAFGNRGKGNKFFWSGGHIDKDAILRPSRRKALAPKVVLMEGEPDAILAQQDFRDTKHQIDFVSGTRGARAAWPVAANDSLLNRDVYICLDNDEEGENSAKKLERALKTKSKVQNIYVIRIPERRGVKDWTDFRREVVTSPKIARQTMLQWMEEAEHVYSRSASEAEASRRAEPPEEAALPTTRVDDAASIAVDSSGAMADVHILGRANNTFYLQTELELTCARDKGKKCDSCPLGEAYEGQDYGEAKLRYFPHERSILEMADASDDQKRKKWRLDSGAKCADVEPTVKDEVAAYPYLVEDSVKRDDDDSEPKQHVMFFVNTGDVASTSVQRVKYHRASYWKDSSAVYWTWATEDMGNDLDNFKMPAASDRRLRKMMAGPVRSKLDEIAADFAWNETHIFGGPRSLLHITIDLAYHSVLRLPFEGQPEMKGWLDVMIMGDSHTGKSATTRKMGEFYGMGGTVNGGSTTRAGLLAGMSASITNSKFMFAKKGALPRNHRGILTIEESHKLAMRKNDGIIAQMADARDNGFFNLQMIGEITAPAATRLIWVANPPGDMSRNKLADFPYGAADAISTMMGGRENVTRLTMALGVSEDEVSADEARPLDKYKSAPRFTGKQRTMRDLLIWSWSRGAGQIDWGEGAQELVRQLSDEIAPQFPDDFPIAMKQDLYAKLARLAAAVAARVYSSPDGVRLVIRRKHVRTAANLLQEVYAVDSLGIQRMAKVGIRAEKAQESTRNELIMQLAGTRAYGLCSQIVSTGEFDPNSLSAMTGMLPHEVGPLMELLNRGEFLRHSGRKVVARRPLIDIATEALERMSGKTVKGKEETVKKRKSARNRVKAPEIK